MRGVFAPGCLADCDHPRAAAAIEPNPGGPAPGRAITWSAECQLCGQGSSEHETEEAALDELCGERR